MQAHQPNNGVDRGVSRAMVTSYTIARHIGTESGK
jgi:hypothetical protein